MHEIIGIIKQNMAAVRHETKPFSVNSIKPPIVVRIDEYAFRTPRVDGSLWV